MREVQPKTNKAKHEIWSNRIHTAGLAHHQLGRREICIRQTLDLHLRGLRVGFKDSCKGDPMIEPYSTLNGEGCRALGFRFSGLGV